MQDMRFPFLDLATVNAPYIDGIREAVERVIVSGRYIGGAEVSRFESALALSTGTDYAVGVSNGLDALRLIFRAYIEMGRLHPGDMVVVPDNTYIASALAVSDAGLVPLLADVSAQTLNLDTSALDAIYNPKVKAVLTVHLYGRPCFDKALADFVERHNLLLIEDNAQAIGARVFDGRPTGSVGHAAAFSFYPTKNIGALGDAGAVTTSDSVLATTVRALANYGSVERYNNIYKGYNCRLDPVQAAVLNVKLPYVEAESSRRRRLAAVYHSSIANPCVRKPLMTVPDESVWHQYCILTEYRDSLKAWLEANGVGCDVNYPLPVHRQKCYSEYADMNLPVADMIASQVLCLPISACTTEADALAISQIINAYEP